MSPSKALPSLRASGHRAPLRRWQNAQKSGTRSVCKFLSRPRSNASSKAKAFVNLPTGSSFAKLEGASFHFKLLAPVPSNPRGVRIGERRIQDFIHPMAFNLPTQALKACGPKALAERADKGRSGRQRLKGAKPAANGGSRPGLKQSKASPGNLERPAKGIRRQSASAVAQTDARKESSRPSHKSRCAAQKIDREWSGDPIITTIPQILNALKEGNVVPGNLIFSGDEDVVAEVRQIWAAYDLTGDMTVGPTSSSWISEHNAEIFFARILTPMSSYVNLFNLLSHLPPLVFEGPDVSTALFHSEKRSAVSPSNCKPGSSPVITRTCGGAILTRIKSAGA